MDLNLFRSVVMLVSFVAFVVIVLRAWRASNAASFAEAAALPFVDGFADGQAPGPRGDAR